MYSNLLSFGIILTILLLVSYGEIVVINALSKCQCCPHIETSQLICTANQLTGFYMRATLALNGLIKDNWKE